MLCFKTIQKSHYSFSCDRGTIEVGIRTCHCHSARWWNGFWVITGHFMPRHNPLLALSYHRQIMGLVFTFMHNYFSLDIFLYLGTNHPSLVFLLGETKIPKILKGWIFIFTYRSTLLPNYFVKINCRNDQLDGTKSWCLVWQEWFMFYYKRKTKVHRWLTTM